MSKRPDNIRASLIARRSDDKGPGVTGMPSRSVKITVELDPATYGHLKQWQAQVSADTGRRVTGAGVARALFEALFDDPALAERVRNRITDR